MEIIGLALLILIVFVLSLAGILYSRGKNYSIEDYITSRNTLKTWPLIATLVASGMGAWILFSPSETAASFGLMSLIGYSLGSASAAFIFIFIGKRIRKLMPFGHSITEYVLHRYGKLMYVLVLVISFFYMMTYLSAELTAVALSANLVFGIPLAYTALVVGIGTVAYTAFGGIQSDFFSDKIHMFLTIPLLVFIFLLGFYAVSGFESFQAIERVNPSILSFANFSGILYGITLMIAIVGAELFNQGNWQRVYAAKSMKIMRRGFFISGCIVIPIILIAGTFGIFSLATGTLENPSISLFSFLLKFAPNAVFFIILILAIALVTSTIDTLLNGMVSLFTVDLARIMKTPDGKKTLRIAKLSSIIITIIPMLVSIKGYSVLYIFLVADFVCAAAAFPTFYGLYSRKMSGAVAFAATILGIISGVFFFPDPSFSSGNLFLSFLLAFLVSLLISVIFSSPENKFDFRQLRKNIKKIS
ncbi:MAG TPA: hypothetical protein VI564_05800 [Candidatus Nanoarchaeia archaeon]|nr:hypothetical protein [Candidatus Nanoarchaeia archaeon]